MAPQNSGKKPFQKRLFFRNASESGNMLAQPLDRFNEAKCPTVFFPQVVQPYAKQRHKSLGLLMLVIFP
jgi:hypothetical protein